MKVWVSVHGRFHAFELASELARRQALAGVATTYPRALARRHLPPGSVLKTAPWLEAYRRLYQALPLGPRPDVPIACAFGRFAAAALPDRADILVGWSGATLEAISPAQRRGMRVVIERGSTHIGHQAEVLGAEYQRLGISGAAVDPVLIERESEEYQAADAIAVPSHFAADTFISRGIDPKKLIVNPYGADLTRYAERRSGSNASIIRVLLVGQVGARKGVPWLLKAFRHLGPQFRLQLVGPVEHYMHPFLRAEDPDRIQVSGPQRSAALEQAFSDADIFCLPSLEEGLPLAMLQAMARGLPIVATSETGARDFLTDGVEGHIVPSRNDEALAQALSRLADPERRRSLGAAAQRRLADGYSWQDYGTRAVSAYEKLSSGNPLEFSRHDREHHPAVQDTWEG